MLESKIKLQNKDNDEILERILCDTKNKLRVLQKYKNQGQKIRAKENWMKDGDRGSKYFFNIIRAKQCREVITTIQTDKGINSCNNDIMLTFYEFYKNLFSLEHDEEKKICMDQCISIIPSKINKEQSNMLGKEISVQEIEETISSLANGKSPCIDGLPAEFYKVNKDWIASELFEVYQFVTDNGSLGHKINQGLIKLLPKDGDKFQVKNWRPITLLNISYKVITKLLANRIAKVLDSIISVT